MDVAALIAKYDRRVPRYTSYPTAPHFSADVDSTVYADWLAALPDNAAVSLYLHVPFCASLCLFCGCHTTVVHRQEPLLTYAETLLAEIDLVADAIGRRLSVRHVHWGGGTPHSLPGASMLAISNRLRQRFAFTADAEVAVEIDPRTLDEETLSAFAGMGVTRASLGVQDFDLKVQEAVGRHQSFEDTMKAAAQLRAIGAHSINLDLIYGLPFQTEPGVRETVGQALQLAPDRAAVFGYAHVPWMKKHQSLLPEAALPGPAERFAQRKAVEDEVVSHGYVRIGLDHFARPEDSLAKAAEDTRLKRNFQGYTTDDAPVLIGLGASSIGSLPHGYSQNHAGVPAWRDAVRAGQLPIARGITLSAEDRLRRDVIEQVMCGFSVDLAATAADHGADVVGLMDAAPALQELLRDELVVWDGRSVQVTDKGRPFVRAVAAAFDTYLRVGATRHSATV